MSFSKVGILLKDSQNRHHQEAYAAAAAKSLQ